MALLVLSCLVMGCGSGMQSTPNAVPSSAVVTSSDLQAFAGEELELRALLLLMSDRLLYEPLAAAAASQGSVELRRQTALTLGRVADRRSLGLLQSLLADPSSRVREAAAFALGEMAENGIEGAAQPLLGSVGDEDQATATVAVEALAKAGIALEDVVERLLVAPPEQLLPRLLPSLFRFRSPGVLRWARQALGADELDAGSGGESGDRAGGAMADSLDPSLRRMAAYAVARNPVPEGAPTLRQLLDDSDPWIRGWGARALGQVGTQSDLERLRRLLDDPEPGPVIQTLRAGRRLVARGTAAPPDEWRHRLPELFDDPRPGVGITALEAATAWLLDEELGERLVRAGLEGDQRQKEVALLALAEAESPRASILVVPFSRHSDPVLRAAAVRAASLVGPAEIIARLASDPAPRVRQAVLEVSLVTSAEPERVALEALGDPDFSSRASALGWAEDNPQLPYEVLLEAYEDAVADRSPDARLAAVRALTARAQAKPQELGTIVQILESMAAGEADARESPRRGRAAVSAGRGFDWLVRRQAADGLRQLGKVPDAPGPVSSGRQIEVYREIALQTSSPRRVVFEVEAGRVELELQCPDAPLTCLAFLQLARQGFYDGLTFHRVIPDFVVQGGDPRGDGAGGPGYVLRDEVNLLRFDAGRLGMAHSGSHTAGSQFFLTLSPQPHLDGTYTAFGRVISGFEFLPQIAQGDRLLAFVSSGEKQP